MAINETELAICRERGHYLKWLDREKWSQCPKCGMWCREVHKVEIEERPDEPPRNERSILDKYRNK